jgi:uncharacterized protein (TIGR02246 family)
MAAARTPEEFHELYEAAYVALDADAVADLHEVDATYAMSALGDTIVGREAIRQAVRQTFAAVTEVRPEWPPPTWLTGGDYAVAHGTSRTCLRFADGTEHEVVSRTTTVLHRGDDGHWRVCVDHGSG